MQIGELWVKMGLDQVGFNKGIADSKGKAQGLGNFLKNALAFTVGQGFTTVIQAGLKAAWSTSIGFNSALQQNQIAFETMLGSATKAKSFLEGLQKMAAETPFEFNDLTDASKKLMAFGFSAEKIPGMLKAIGDASSGLGMTGSEGINRIGIALGQMSAKGKVSSQEMLQLTEAGIPAWDMLAKATGKSTAEIMKMTEKGMIPANQAIDVLIAGMEQRFPNMMDKQSHSFQGLMSTIKDNISIALGAATQNMFNKLTGLLETAAKKTQVFADTLKSSGIKAALSTILPAPVMAGFNILNNIFAWIINNGAAVKAALIGIASGYAAILIIKQVNSAVSAFQAGMNLLPTATGLVGRLGTAFMELKTAPSMLSGISGAFKAIFGITPQVAAIIAIVAALAAAAYLIYKNWSVIGPFAKSLGQMVYGCVKVAGNSIMVVFKELAVGIAKFIQVTAGNIGKFVAGVLNLGTKIPLIGNKFKGALSGVEAFNNGINNMVANAEKSLGSSKLAVGNAVNDIKEGMAGIKSNGAVLGKAIAEGTKNLFSKAKSSVTSALKGITGSSKSTAKTVTNDFNTQTPNMKQAGAALGNALGEGLKKAASKKSAEAAKAAAKKALEAAKEAVISGVNNLNDQIITALQNKYNQMQEAAENSINKQLTDLDNWKTSQEAAINDVYDKRVTALDGETKAAQDSIQKQIDAIDDLQEKEDRAKQDNIDNQNLDILNKKMAAANNPLDQLSYKAQIEKLQKEMDDRHHTEQQEDQKAELQKALENIQTEADAKKQVLENQKTADLAAMTDEYNARKDVLDKQLKDIDDFYKEKLKQANIQAEAEKMIVDKNQKEIVALLKGYGDLYGAAGQSLGERLFNGVKSWTDLIPTLVQSAVESINKLKAAGKITATTTSKNNSTTQTVKWYGTGGIFTQPAVVGVGDVPEVVAPLTQLPDLLSKFFKGIVINDNNSDNGGNGDQVVNVYVKAEDLNTMQKIISFFNDLAMIKKKGGRFK